MKRAALAVACAAVLAGCVPAPADPSDPNVGAEPVPAPFKPSENPVALDVTLIDGKRLATRDLLNRLTLVVFLATYDTASQAEARIAAAVVSRHKPRINGLGIVLEPTANLPLVQTFATALNLPYPLAMADAETLAGRGPFPGMHHVPSLALLDRQGREVWRYFGVATVSELEAVLLRHESR
jgi:hypothetical protein